MEERVLMHFVNKENFGRTYLIEIEYDSNSVDFPIGNWNKTPVFNISEDLS